MKKSIATFVLTTATLLIGLAGCKKDDNNTTAPPANNTAIFTAKIAGDAYNAPDSSFLMNGAGGTIAVFSKDATGRSFQMAIFEKDFPVGKAVGIAYSPSLSYKDAQGVTYIAKDGSLTVSEYYKSTSNTVNRMAGTFTATMTANGNDLQITEGKFDVKTR